MGIRIAPSVLLLGMALALAGCPSVQRQVISIDEQAKREVAVLTGTEPPEVPPHANFRNPSTLDLESSLKRLVVRPSTWATFMRTDPEPLLSPDQVAWARNVLMEQLPGLAPDQRVQLRFPDRFHQYETAVEVAPDGRFLVYRFTALADQPERNREPGTNPVRYAALEPQPGQEYDTERRVEILRDPVFDRAGREDVLAQTSAILAEAIEAKRFQEAELTETRIALETHPGISPDALRLYLDKLELVVKGKAQGLFTEAEAAERRQRLLDELQP